jgi:hypothetical protein
MNIEKITNGFTTIIDIGIFSIFVHTKKNGITIGFNELFNTLQYYNSVVFLGDDPLLQKEEVGKLLKKLVNNNNNIQLQLHTSGLISPLYFNDYKDNTIIYVYININDKKQLKTLINTFSLNWFVDVGCKFIFIIKELKELNEVESLINIFSIKKENIYIKPTNEYKSYMEDIKYKKYNIAVDVEW